MNHDELGRAIKAACAYLDEPQVIVFGSQSILGSYDTSELPAATFVSREVNILPLMGITDPPSVEDKQLLLDAQLSEDAPFHDHHGFYVEGTPKDVVALPTNWENRLVHFTVDDGLSPLYERTGLCLDPIDLCASKALAGREKDREFVAALMTKNLVDAEQILDRIDGGIDWPPGYRADSRIMLDRARSWLKQFADHRPGETGQGAPAADPDTAEG